ncbi:MAG: 2-phosphosulfolactate phosphatase [Sporomusaceae bacterium]|nr:2-phosphosulfolactate phosphatase [Sporomusaceae bacterium]
MEIDVCLTPSAYLPQPEQQRIAVVIDVFRATSSMAAAFAQRCEAIIPVQTVEASWREKQIRPDALLAGEREALKIPGFDLGNSPREFTAAAVSGKTIIMSTTNGTAALLAVADASAVYAASFVNAAAVCRLLRECGRNTVLVCAGRKGEFALEDALCAGLLADRLADSAVLSDAAQFARAAYRKFAPDLLPSVAASRHARYLSRIGLAEDVGWCLQSDCIDIVPRFRDGVVAVADCASRC